MAFSVTNHGSSVQWLKKSTQCLVIMSAVFEFQVNKPAKWAHHPKIGTEKLLDI